MKKSLMKWAKWIVVLLLATIGVVASAYMVASFYKKEILAYFHQELNAKMKGKVSMSDLSFTIFHPFPQLTITLRGVNVQDTVYDTKVLEAERVFLQLHLLKLLGKQLDVKSVIIQDAVLFIHKDSLGYSNLSAFQTKHPIVDNENKKSSSLDFNLKEIAFRKVSCTYQDDTKGKDLHLQFNHLHAKTRPVEGGHHYFVKGQVFTKGLSFNSAKGAFLKNKEVELDLHLGYSLMDSMLVLRPSTVEIEQVRYEVTGKSKLQKQPIIYLDIDAKEADYDKAMGILNDHLQKALSKFHVDKGLSCQVQLALPTKPGVQPIAKVAFQLQGSALRVLDYHFDQTTLSGKFTNQADTLLPLGDLNSEVQVMDSDFLYKGLACKVQGNLRDFIVSKIQIQATAQGPLQKLHYLLDTTQFRFKGGDFAVKLHYAGAMLPKSISSLDRVPAAIKGKIEIKNGQLALISKHWDISAMKGSIAFTESDISMKEVHCALNENVLKVSSELKGVVPFLLFPNKKMHAQFTVSSPYFDINKLLKKTVKTAEKQKRNLQPFMQHLNEIADKIDLKASVDIQKMKYRKIEASHVKGILSLNKNAATFRRWSLDLVHGGKVSMDASYAFQGKEAGLAQFKATLRHIDAPSLFYGFSDFGQKTLRHEHLAGRINAQVRLQCYLDEEYNPIQKSIYGGLALTLEKGELKNFEPLSHVSKLVFKHRDLQHIKFDQISNQFLLRGEEFYIQKMNVNSSVLTLFLEGVYSFKTKTDLSIQIPLANLKDNKEEFYNLKGNQHGNIRLRAKEKEGKMTVSLDLFNRYHNKDSVKAREVVN